MNEEDAKRLVEIDTLIQEQFMQGMKKLAIRVMWNRVGIVILFILFGILAFKR